MPDQTSGRFAIALYALYILFLAVPLHAADKTTAKDFITEPATLRHSNPSESSVALGGP